MSTLRKVTESPIFSATCARGGGSWRQRLAPARVRMGPCRLSGDTRRRAAHLLQLLGEQDARAAPAAGGRGARGDALGVTVSLSPTRRLAPRAHGGSQALRSPVREEVDHEGLRALRRSAGGRPAASVGPSFGTCISPRGPRLTSAIAFSSSSEFTFFTFPASAFAATTGCAARARALDAPLAAPLSRRSATVPLANTDAAEETCIDSDSSPPSVRAVRRAFLLPPRVSKARAKPELFPDKSLSPAKRTSAQASFQRAWVRSASRRLRSAEGRGGLGFLLD